MLFAPINPADLNQVEGTYAALPASLPAVGGNEGCGIVESVGDKVSGLAKGDLVIAAAAGLGTWRTHGTFAADQLLKLPNDVAPEYAAVLGVNVCTAYRLLTDFGELTRNDVVLANGGSSGVVSALAALCGARGLRLVVEARPRSDWNDLVSRLKAAGAEAVVESGFLRTPQGKALLADMPAPKLALNCVGGASATDLARLLAPGGTLVTYGGMSHQPVTLPTSLLIFGDVRVRGFWMTAWNASASQEQRTAMINDVLALVRGGGLKVRTALRWLAAQRAQMFLERHDFSAFDKALARALEPQRSRKVLLDMSK